MQQLSTTPRRIEWTGPEGFTVFADEDGVHLRAPGGHALEQPDVERLFTLWNDACSLANEGTIPAPRPITREQARQLGALDRERWLKRRVIDAVKAELDGPGF